MSTVVLAITATAGECNFRVMSFFCVPVDSTSTIMLVFIATIEKT